MAEPDVTQSLTIDISDSGVAATHPIAVDFPRPVAPTQPGKDEHNTLRDFLLVVGCAMFPDVTFEFDSSLVGPEVRAATRRLARLRDDLQDFEQLKDGEAKAFPPLSLFGHADPQGQLAYNSRLSARRALCIYGMLIRDVEIWEDLWNDRRLAGDRWGDPELDRMLDEVGFPPELEPRSEDEAARKRVRARLEKKSGAAERALLFRAYMDAVCVREGPSERDEPFVLGREHFLGRGEHRDLRGDLQGCGEFNPVLILSSERTRDFEKRRDKEGRNAANVSNRRVLAFLFKPGTRIVPDKWPCPSHRDKAPEETCKKRLWSDHKRRLQPAEKEDRKFNRSEDTFGCRFYHGFAHNSPCEGIQRLWVIRLGIDDALVEKNGEVERDDRGRARLQHPLARKRFVVEAGTDPGAPLVRGRTDEAGVLRLPVFDEVTTMKLRLDTQNTLLAPPPPDPQRPPPERPEKEFLEIVLAAGALETLDEAEPAPVPLAQRLSNLGYGPDKPASEWSDEERGRAIASFQRKHRLEPSGAADAPTVQKLQTVHGS